MSSTNSRFASRRLPAFSPALVALLVFTAAACSDEPSADDENDTGVQSDATTDTNLDLGDTTDGGADTGDDGDTDVDIRGLPPNAVYPENCAATTPGPPDTLVLTPVLEGDNLLRQPVDMIAANDGSDRVFIVNKPGQIVAATNMGPDGTTSIWVDLDDGRVDDGGGEMGLLGLALHPNFGTNGQFFVNYTSSLSPDGIADPERHTRVSRFVVRDGDGAPDPDGTIDISQEDILITINQPYGNHNGGGIAFDQDGYLLIGMGDGGDANDPDERAQNGQELLGKMLRIDVDSTTGELNYGIPEDNPFLDDDGTRDEIFAVGLRNPWRFSVDPVDGTIWLGDVGQSAREEVDIIVSGGNYGWDIMEGTLCHEPSSGCDQNGLILPVAEYDRSVGTVVTGGRVYRGDRVTEFRGVYFFADYGSGRIFTLTPDGEDWILDTLYEGGPPTSAFGIDTDGELYIVDYSGGILRMDPPASGAGGGPQFVDTLSETGCFNDELTDFVPGIIGYGVNNILWSDDAFKWRGIALPTGSQMVYSDTEAWQLPQGGILIKNFELNGRVVETRFLVRAGDGYIGSAYRWNDEGTEADRVEEAITVEIDGQDWFFPGPSDCNSCHTEVAGRLLGIRTAQFNGNYDMFGLGEVQQIEALSALSYFDVPPTSDPEDLPALVAIDDPDASREERARSYLMSNCAHCHTAGGPTGAPMDFHHLVDFGDMGICGVTPTNGLGVEDPAIIDPGSPETSTLLLRIDRTGGAQMPPLARNLIDDEAVEVIEAWINELDDCPE